MILPHLTTYVKVNYGKYDSSPYDNICYKLTVKNIFLWHSVESLSNNHQQQKKIKKKKKYSNYNEIKFDYYVWDRNET